MYYYTYGLQRIQQQPTSNLSINGEQIPAGQPTVQNCEQHRPLLQDVQPPNVPVEPPTTATLGATHQTDGDSILQQEHLPQTTLPAQQYSLPIRAPLGGITLFSGSLFVIISGSE